MSDLSVIFRNWTNSCKISNQKNEIVVFRYILTQEEDSLIFKFLMAQKEEKKGDWYSEVRYLNRI